MSDEILIAVGEYEDDKAVNYVRALEAAGVPSERIRVLEPDRSAAPGSDEGSDSRDFRQMARRAAGLVLAGGGDPRPSLYGEDEIEGADISIDDARDAMELELLEGAREAGTPVWGVCRGFQLLNVFLGGTLYQDIPLQLPSQVPHQVSSPADGLIHELTVDASRAAASGVEAALARETPLVNSRHHQGIKDLAAELVPVAWAPDGLVEAFYLGDRETGEPSPWWVHGVQWHPENLIALDQQRALWRAFVDRVDHVDRVEAAG
jgi:putative glutamine amidotransferase